MEVICINDIFPTEVLEIYNHFGVKTPKDGTIYNIRDMVKHTNGLIGVLLEEIVNPEIPYSHPILGTLNKEPTFNVDRFRTLLNNEIDFYEKHESEVSELRTFRDIKENGI